MRFHVEVGAKLRTVTVEGRGDVLHVTFDGRTHLVDVRRINGGSLSLLLQKPDEVLPVRSVEASLVPGRTPGTFDVHLAGQQLLVQFRNGSPRRLGRDGAGPEAAGPQRVSSPMPGKVVRVLVKPGDQVDVRQGLVVVEAMKMENELKAARGGRVRDVAVVEGQSVDAGQILLVVE